MLGVKLENLSALPCYVLLTFNNTPVPGISKYTGGGGGGAGWKFTYGKSYPPGAPMP